MKRTILHEGRYARFVRVDGWEYVERTTSTGIVLIVALTDDGRLVLLEQYRHPVGRTVIELPAGLVGDVPGEREESMEVAAKRELLEETGWAARSMTFLTEGPPSSGISAESITFFRATGLAKVGDGGGDDSESIIVHEVPLPDVERWLESQRHAGHAIDPKIYAALWFLRDSA